MKTIIIDGYNIIHRIPAFSLKLKESLKAARNELALYLSLWKKRYSNAEVYIIFDSKSNDGFNFDRMILHGINCLFSEATGEADEHIKSMVRDSGEPGSILVISDDNNIRQSCRIHGAMVKRADFLLKK